MRVDSRCGVPYFAGRFFVEPPKPAVTIEMANDDTKLMLPSCIAMILCDVVSQDGGNKKYSLLGTFDSVTPATLPAAIKLGLYFVLVALRKPCDIEVRAVHAADLFDAPGSVAAKIAVTCTDPLQEMPIGFELILPLQKAGTHYIQLFVEDQQIAERRLIVLGNPQSLEGDTHDDND